MNAITTPAADSGWNAVRARIVRAMGETGISQRKLAAEAKCEQAALSRFLSGKSESMTLATLEGLGTALGVDLWAVYGARQPAAGDVGEIPGGIVAIPLTQLKPSPLNPRKHFDQPSLDELADSIERSGLLQNLVVTQDGTTYAIVAGERRYRALRQLVEAGRLPVETTVPCRVVDAFDEAEHRALAIVENLQRENIQPLEEAEAFAALARPPFAWSTQQIADTVKRSRRHVQLRLALVEKLAEPARKALAKGTITLAEARVLATVPEDRQQEGLRLATSKNEWERPKTAEQLRSHMLRDYVDVARALVQPSEDEDLAALGIVMLEPDDEHPEGWRAFRNTDAFKAWQAASIERLEAQYRAEGWAFVDVGEAWDLAKFYEEAPESDDEEDGGDRFLLSEDRSAAGVAIFRGGYHGTAELHVGVLRKPDLFDQQTKADAARQREEERRKARQKAYGALQQTIRDRADLMLALRLVIYGHWSSWDAPGPHLSSVGGTGRMSTKAAIAIAPAIGAMLAEGGTSWADPAEAWATLQRLASDKPQAIDALAAAILARGVQLPQLPYDTRKPHVDAVVAALAAELTIPIDACLTVAGAPADAEGEAQP